MKPETANASDTGKSTAMRKKPENFLTDTENVQRYTVNVLKKDILWRNSQ